MAKGKVLDRDREHLIERLCCQAHVEAEDLGAPRIVVVCAGPQWCDGGEGNCHWCTRVVVSPDGGRCRTEPHVA